MFTHWPYLLLLLPAAPLAWEDFRTREVSVVWLLTLACICVATGWVSVGPRPLLEHTAVNAGVLALSGCMMSLWQLMRRGSLREFLSTALGAGDVVMIAAVMPLFEPMTYVRYLLASCVAALAWWCLKSYFSERPANIPLAGFMALGLVVYATCKFAGIWN